MSDRRRAAPPEKRRKASEQAWVRKQASTPYLEHRQRMAALEEDTATARELLRLMRKRLGLKIREVTELTGMNYAPLWRIESGYVKRAKPETVKKITAAYREALDRKTDEHIRHRVTNRLI